MNRLILRKHKSIIPRSHFAEHDLCYYEEETDYIGAGFVCRSCGVKLKKDEGWYCSCCLKNKP